MTLRDWVAAKLREANPPYESQARGVRGLIVARGSLPDAPVYCADADDIPFAAIDLGEARRVMPGLGFVVVIRRKIANDAYEAADEAGVAIGGFLALTYALASSADVGVYRSATQDFIASRLAGTAVVSSWRRFSYSGYQINRRGALRPVDALMIDGYEVTADEVLATIVQNRGIDIDVLVATNPNCHGFSNASVRAAQNAGVTLIHFRDFLEALRTQWIS